MEQYISHSKDLIDHVQAVSDSPSDREQMLYVLGGLDGHYESTVTIVTNKKEVLTLDEFFTRMRTHDKYMESIQMLDS